MGSDNRGKLSQFLNETLLPALSAEQIFTDPAHRFHKSGDKWRGGCPRHKSASGTSFTVTPSSKLWWCQGCHVGGGPVQYLWRLKGNTGTPRGLDFVQVLEELAGLACLTVPKAEWTTEDIEREHKRETRRSILQAVMTYCQENIQDAVRPYLASRGFDDEAIKDLGVGFYPSSKNMADFLKEAGYDLKAANDAGVLWRKWEGYILFPWHDEYGRPLTLYGTWQAKKPPLKKDIPAWKKERDKAFEEWNALPEVGKERLPWEEPRVPKKLALPNPKGGDDVLEHTKRVPLYFDRARRASHKHIVLVEGVTDAALAQVEGDTRVIACVAAGFSHEQVETLKRCGIETVTICLDPDQGGASGTASCVRMLDEAGIKPLIAPRLPEGMDPDDFIIKYGIDAWKAHIAAAKTPLQVEIDAIAAQDLSLLKLSDALKPVVEKLAGMPPMEAEGYLDHLKTACKLNNESIKAIRKELQAKAKELQATAGRDDDQHTSLDSLQTVPRIHPAIDFHEDFMTLGFRVDQGEAGDGILLVLADSGQVKALVNQGQVECGGLTYRVKSGAPPFVNDTWGLDALRDFAQNPVSAQTLFVDLKQAFRVYLDMPEQVYGLLATWTAGSYFAHMFTAFPFLHFHGPKECGKSKTLEALRCVCFNAWKGRDVSVAALGDTTDGQRGTLLLDQAEKLDGSPENGGNLIGLLADSYKKAGGQRRVVEVTKVGRSVLEFSCYGPKAFASTKALDPDLADRCVRVPMTRTRNRLPDLEGWEPIWTELRDKLYRFTLSSFEKVRAHYQCIEGTGTRIGELWRPMQAVLQALGVEQREIEEIQLLFTAGAEEGRHELDGWEACLFDVLRQKAEEGMDAFKMTGADILKAMDILGENKPGNPWVGSALSRFSLISGISKREYVDGRKQKVKVYPFNSTHIFKMYEIYMRDTPLNDMSHMSQAENSNDSNGSHGTGIKHGTSPNVSQVAGPDNLGPGGTCPTEKGCPTEPIEIITDFDVGPAGQANQRGMASSGDDVSESGDCDREVIEL
jgi:DNA primase